MLTLSFIFIAFLSFSANANELEQRLIPQIKQIIIEHAKTESTANQAYKKVQQIAVDAIDYRQGNESRELSEIFSEIENEASYDYFKLNKEQMVSLIIKAINS